MSRSNDEVQNRERVGDFYVHLYDTKAGAKSELTSSTHLFKQAMVTVLHFYNGG